jgi:hypothetical protein
VLGGVVTSTFLVTLFAPLFYVLIFRIFKGKEPLLQTSENCQDSATSPGPDEVA